MKYFEQSFDGELIIINSGTVKNDEELLTCFGKYSQSTKAIIIGHSHQPSIANRELVGEFWRNIYSISDMRFTILRNPLERSISWIKEAGNLGDGAVPSHGISYRFRGLPQDQETLAACIENQRGPRSILNDSIFDCILPENFYVDTPDNLNIASSIANYPIELMSSDQFLRWLTPLPCRKEKDIFEFKILFENVLTIDELIKYLSIPRYEFYALEKIDDFVKRLESLSITKPGFSVPHINISKTASVDISLKVKRTLINLYPESYLLWKHAIGLF